MDPITIAGSALLTEGIKFLYGQATEVLKRWRERREEPITNENATGPVLDAPPGLLATPVEQTPPDYDALERLEPELSQVWNSLTPYAQGVWSVPGDATSNVTLREQVALLRGMLEAIYGQRITFVGEDRPPPPHPGIRATVSVDDLLGDAAAVRAKTINSGAGLDASAQAGTVRAGGKLTAIEVDHLGVSHD